MQRVTPSEPFNEDPDAHFLRVASRPGPVFEHHAPRAPVAWLLLALVLLLAVVLSARAGTDTAPEPQPSPAEVKRERSAAQACPPGHAVLWISSSAMQCLPERP